MGTAGRLVGFLMPRSNQSCIDDDVAELDLGCMLRRLRVTKLQQEVDATHPCPSHTLLTFG